MTTTAAMSARQAVLLALTALLTNGSATVSGESISGTPYQTPKDVFSRRIEFETVTVDDMDKATRYYQGILGATPLDFCSKKSPYCTKSGEVIFRGDQHVQAMFSLEEARFEDFPDIGDAGLYEARTKFFVLGNGVVQLLKFAAIEDGSVYELREPMTSPCWLGAAHLCFWIDDDVDMNDYIYDSEAASKQADLPDVAWNRPVPQETREDRNKVPKDQLANSVVGGPFGGLEWSYYKGPIGEQLELYRITGNIKQGIGAAYCERGAVSRTMADKNHPDGTPTPKRVAGFYQFGIRVHDLHAAVGFYSEVLGGNLITYPTQGIDIRGTETQWMIFANETIESYEYAEEKRIFREQAMRMFGAANLTGGMRLDHRFILFDNFVVEPLLYTDGLSFGGDPFNPKWSHMPSVGYVGSISGAFGVPEGMALSEALVVLKKKAKVRGYSHVYIPEATASFPSDHPFSGFEYAYGKGVSEEVISFVTIDGNFKKVLKKATEESGGVSTMFYSTNVYLNGEMKTFCDSVKQQQEQTCKSE